MKNLYFITIQLFKKKKGETGNDKESCLLSEEILFQCLNDIEKKLNPIKRVQIKNEQSNVKLNEYYLVTIAKELIENALKFSDENSAVKVEGRIEQGIYRLQVTDFGRGISERDVNLINAFEKFGKQQFSEPGFGLGLTIVKKIIKLQNCEFLITSEIDKNTICEVFIPIN